MNYNQLSLEDFKKLSAKELEDLPSHIYDKFLREEMEQLPGWDYDHDRVIWDD